MDLGRGCAGLRGKYPLEASGARLGLGRGSPGLQGGTRWRPWGAHLDLGRGSFGDLEGYPGRVLGQTSGELGPGLRVLQLYC